ERADRALRRSEPVPGREERLDRGVDVRAADAEPGAVLRRAHGALRRVNGGSVKAVYFERYGGPDVLTYGERPAPQPEAGEALIRVRACAVNRLDLWVRAGLPGLKPEMPHVLGNDGGGEVGALGAGVHHVREGEKP